MPLRAALLILFIGTNLHKEHAADLQGTVFFISSQYNILRHQTPQNRTITEGGRKIGGGYLNDFF